MRTRQIGVSLGGLLVGSVILIFVALLGLKLAPPYMEYFTIKKAIAAITQERQGATAADVRRAFDARAAIDDITAIRGQDLEITKEGNELLISIAYRKEVPLFSNIGVYMDFAAKSKE